MDKLTSHEYIISLTKSIVPMLRYDGVEDYESWRERAAAKLYDLLGLPFELCEDRFEITGQQDCKDYIRTDFVFQSEKGYFVPGGFLLPKGADKPLPLAICIQGHSSGMHISYGIPRFPGDEASIAGGRNFAERAVKEGCCAIVLEQRYMGTCGQVENGEPTCCNFNTALPSVLLGRTAIGERVWDVQRLLDIAEKYFSHYYDKEKVICLGNSGGGTTTYFVSCVDDRIKLSVPSCSVCEFEDSIVPIHHCCCSYIPGIRKYFEMGDMGGLLASRNLVIVCGVHDPDFPIHGVETSFERAKKVFTHIAREENCRIVKGSAGHQFYPDLAWPVMKELIPF